MSVSNDPWKSRSKHILILTSAGKPVWSRWGDTDDFAVSTLCSVLQAVHSRCSDGGGNDVLQSVTSGEELIVFSQRGPLLLAAICRTSESAHSLSQLLRLLHAHLLLGVTSKLHARLDARPGTDVRPLLIGTDLPLRTMVRLHSRSPALWLDAYPVLSLLPSLRHRVTSILASAGSLSTRGMGAAAKGPFSSSGGVVYAVLLAGYSLVAWAQPRSREHALRPGDVSLLSTFLACSGALRVADAWTPLCLPGLSDGAYVHAYVSCLGTVNASGSRAAGGRQGQGQGQGQQSGTDTSDAGAVGVGEADMYRLSPMQPSSMMAGVGGAGPAGERRAQRAGWLGGPVPASEDAEGAGPPVPVLLAVSPNPLPSPPSSSSLFGMLTEATAGGGQKGASLGSLLTVTESGGEGLGERRRLTFVSPLAVPLTPVPGPGGVAVGAGVLGASAFGLGPLVLGTPETPIGEEEEEEEEGEALPTTPPPSHTHAHVEEDGAPRIPQVPPSPWQPPLPYHPDADRDPSRGAGGSGTPLWLLLVSTGADGSPAYVDALAAKMGAMASQLAETGLLAHVAAIQASAGPFATGSSTPGSLLSAASTASLSPPPLGPSPSPCVHFMYLWKPTRQFSVAPWPAQMAVDSAGCGSVSKSSHARRKALLRAYCRVYEEVTAATPHLRHAVHAYKGEQREGEEEDAIGAIAGLHTTNAVLLATFGVNVPATAVPGFMERLAKIIKRDAQERMLAGLPGVL